MYLLGSFKLTGFPCNHLIPFVFTGFPWIYMISSVFTGFPMYLLDFLCIYWISSVFTGFPLSILDFLCIYWISFVFTGFLCIYWISSLINGFPRHLLDFFCNYYWISQESAEFSLNLLDSVRFVLYFLDILDFFVLTGFPLYLIKSVGISWSHYWISLRITSLSSSNPISTILMAASVTICLTPLYPNNVMARFKLFRVH